MKTELRLDDTFSGVVDVTAASDRIVTVLCHAGVCWEKDARNASYRPSAAIVAAAQAAVDAAYAAAEAI